VFNDRRVREAITLAFDFEWMNKALFYGAYSRANSYFRIPNMPRAGARCRRAGPADADESRSAAGGLHLRLSAAALPRRWLRPRNLLKADALLKQAGWVLKNQRRINAATGKPLRFELLLPSGGNDRWVLPFQHNLQRLGITMDIRQVDNSQYSNRRRSRDYDMMPSVWRATPWREPTCKSPGIRHIFTPATMRPGFKARWWIN
jgi:microcin C transport system substrate-binding protein